MRAGWSSTRRRPVSIRIATLFSRSGPSRSTRAASGSATASKPRSATRPELRRKTSSCTASGARRKPPRFRRAKHWRRSHSSSAARLASDFTAISTARCSRAPWPRRIADHHPRRWLDLAPLASVLQPDAPRVHAAQPRRLARRSGDPRRAAAQRGRRCARHGRTSAAPARRSPPARAPTASTRWFDSPRSAAGWRAGIAAIAAGAADRYDAFLLYVHCPAIMSFSFAGKFPHKRPRRMRRDEFSRRMMRETRLSADDFIYPVFVLDGGKREEPVASLPGVSRKSDRPAFPGRRAVPASLGVPAMALFPVVPEPSSSRWMPRQPGIPRDSCRGRSAR